MPVVLSGLLTLLLSIGLGVLVIHFGFALFRRMTPGLDETREIAANNTAVAIVCGAFLVAVGIVVKPALRPVVETFFTTIYQPSVTPREMLLGAAALLLQIFSAFVVAVLGLLLGLRILTYLSREVDEIEQIRANNTAVAILLGAVLITLALFLEEGLTRFLQSLIPAPRIQNDLLRPFG